MIAWVDPNLRVTFWQAVRCNWTTSAASSSSGSEQPVSVYKLPVQSVRVQKGDSTERVRVFRNWLMPTAVCFLVSVSTSRWVGTNPATSSSQSLLLNLLQSLALHSESWPQCQTSTGNNLWALCDDRRLHAEGTKSSEGDAMRKKSGGKQDGCHHFEGLTLAQRLILTPQCEMAQKNHDATQQVGSSCNLTEYGRGGMNLNVFFMMFKNIKLFTPVVNAVL